MSGFTRVVIFGGKLCIGRLGFQLTRADGGAASGALRRGGAAGSSSPLSGRY